jgi:ribose transport system substrate-binding protein
MKRLMAWMMMVGLVCAGCSQQSPTTDTTTDTSTQTVDPTETLRIAVIPKGTTHEFWKSIHAGAAKAADELNVEIIWTGPEKEDDRAQQIQVVQNFVSSGVNAIVLAPLDNVALARPVETAVQRKIPVVIIDSDLNSQAHSSFVATDNKEGGRLGARRLAEVLGGKGKVILLRYAEGSASTHNREEGFLEEIAKHTDIELISDNQYAGATKESALQASQSLLNKYPDVQGIFCPNESSAFGMLRALQNNSKAGKVQFVGFDTSEALIAGLEAGEIMGLVSQDPFDMGYQGVKTAVAVINGETVEANVATRLEMITQDNLSSPEIQALVNPDLDKWLK